MCTPNQNSLSLILKTKEMQTQKRDREEGDAFIACIEKSRYSQALKEAATEVIQMAIDQGKRTSVDEPATVLVGINGFYAFRSEQKPFLQIRQKAIVFDGKRVSYVDVRVIDKFPDTPLMHAKFHTMPVATYVGMVPIPQQPPVRVGMKPQQPLNTCPAFPHYLVSHKTYTRHTTARAAVYKFISNKSDEVYDGITESMDHADANGFGVVSLLLCRFVAALHQLSENASEANSQRVATDVKKKPYRRLQLQIASDVCGAYTNYTRNGEVLDENLAPEPTDLFPYKDVLVFVNPTLAPNSKNGSMLCIFTNGYSGLYGTDSPIHTFVPLAEFARFNEEVGERSTEPANDGIVDADDF